MLQRVYTFGETVCEIDVDSRSLTVGGAVFVAKMFMQEHEGRAVRQVGDGQGKPLELHSSWEEGALNRAVAYLENRFGTMGPAPLHDANEAPHRPITEPPLKDDRPV